jgi:hypothetical protein
VLPDFLTPYRRYLTVVREAVVTGEDPAPPCDARTACRWLQAFFASITLGIHVLTSMLQQQLPTGRQEAAFLNLGAASANTLRQVREIMRLHDYNPPASCLLGWANQTLNTVSAAAL